MRQAQLGQIVIMFMITVTTTITIVGMIMRVRNFDHMAITGDYDCHNVIM